MLTTYCEFCLISMRITSYHSEYTPEPFTEGIPGVGVPVVLDVNLTMYFVGSLVKAVKVPETPSTCQPLFSVAFSNLCSILASPSVEFIFALPLIFETVDENVPEGIACSITFVVLVAPTTSLAIIPPPFPGNHSAT